MVDAEPYGGAEAAAASGGDGVARPPQQRRRHSRLGQRRPTAAPSARSALLKLKNETAIWNRRLAPRARARVTEMVDAEQFLSAHSSVTQSGGAGARAASRSLGVARPSPIHKN